MNSLNNIETLNNISKVSSELTRRMKDKFGMDIEYTIQVLMWLDDDYAIECRYGTEYISYTFTYHHSTMEIEYNEDKFRHNAVIKKDYLSNEYYVPSELTKYLNSSTKNLLDLE
jgi:hypothetical protein